MAINSIQLHNTCCHTNNTQSYLSYEGKCSKCYELDNMQVKFMLNYK
jgi:hypothetical protein